MKALGYSWNGTLLKDITFTNSTAGNVTVTKTYGNATSATSVFNGNLTAYNSAKLGGKALSDIFSLSGNTLTITY